MERLPNPTGLETGTGTHEGMSGKHNEDSLGLFAWQVDDQRTLTLAIVADGIGGQAAGERASSVAVDTMCAYFDRLTVLDVLPTHLQEAIAEANRAVYAASQERDELRGMGTTIAAVALLDQRIFTAYVGDSRIYRLRDGALQQLSIDHTWAQEAIEAGLLTREQAKTHPNRNVIKQYLGSANEVTADLRLRLVNEQSQADMVGNQGVRLQPGDTILICSDGLTDMIDDEAVRTTLLAYETLPPAVATLIDKANAAGGKDNITVVTLRLPGKQPAAVARSAPPAASPAPPAPVVPAPAGAGGGLGISLALLGGLGFGALALIIIVIGFFLMRGRGSDGEATLTPSSGAVDEAQPEGDPGTDPAGAPATVGALDALTADAANATVDPLATPTQRPPDLLSTSTPTFTPPAPPRPLTATSTPDASPTASSDGDGGGNGGSGGGGTLPTNTPPPGSTPSPTPNPTNTSAPPPSPQPRPTITVDPNPLPTSQPPPDSY